MRKIRYNIAENKKIDAGKFAFYSGIVLLISILFVMWGIGNLWSLDKREQEQIEKQKEDRLRVERLEEKTTQYEEQIRTAQSRWKKEVAFSNILINGKQFSVIQRLNILEKHLPEGVMITYVGVDYRKPATLHLQVAATSLEKLVESYKSFSGFSAQVKDEKEDQGMFTAAVVLTMKEFAPKKKKKK